MNGNFNKLVKYIGLAIGLSFAVLFIFAVMGSFAWYLVSLALGIEHLYDLNFKPISSADYILQILVFWLICKLLLGVGKKLFNKE